MSVIPFKSTTLSKVAFIILSPSAIGCPEISLFHRTVKHSWASIPFGLITDHANFQTDTPMAWFLELDLKKTDF